MLLNEEAVVEEVANRHRRAARRVFRQPFEHRIERRLGFALVLATLLPKLAAFAGAWVESCVDAVSPSAVCASRRSASE